MTVLKRTRTITIATRHRTVLRWNASQTRWCEFCSADVEMRSPGDAAGLIGITEREVFRRIEKGSLHFFENESGQVYICLGPLNPTRR